MQTEIERDWLTKEEATAFAGKNAPYYLEQWKLHADTTLKGWNWAAAIFGIEWLAYRRLYREALLSFVLLLLCAFVLALIGLDGDFFGYSYRLLIGMLGNMLYRNKALRALRSVTAAGDPQPLEALARKGGASPAGVVGIILLELLWSYLTFV